MAINLSGSWVAMPIPFDKKGAIDYDGFKTLIDRQIKYGTSQLFVLGSAAEVSLLTAEEKKEIIRQTVSIVKQRIPVFFSAASNTTEGEIEIAKFAESTTIRPGLACRLNRKRSNGCRTVMRTLWWTRKRPTACTSWYRYSG